MFYTITYTGKGFPPKASDRVAHYSESMMENHVRQILGSVRNASITLHKSDPEDNEKVYKSPDGYFRRDVRSGRIQYVKVGAESPVIA